MVAVRGTLSVADAFTDLTIGMKKVSFTNEPLLDGLDTRVHKVSWLWWDVLSMYVQYQVSILCYAK